MIDVKLLLAKILNQLVPMNRLDVEEYTLLDGSTTINAGKYKRGTLNISKDGYYPVAITGYDSSSERVAPYRLNLLTIASGSGQIVWGVINAASGDRSPTFTVYVLWEKI